MPIRLALVRGLMSLGFIAMMLLAAPFVVHAVARGLSMNASEEMLSSRFFHADAALATAAIYGHMVTGGILTALAPLQMVGAVRRRWPKWHHRNGYAVAALSELTGASGLIYIAAKGTIGGPLMSAGFGLYGLLLIGAALRTVWLARRGDPRHGAWAGRLIILALASWFYRVQYGLWDIVFGEAGRQPDFSGAFDLVMNVAFYLPWLIIYELVRLRIRARS